MTGLLLILGSFAAYVGLAAGKELMAARSILGTPAEELEAAQIDAAESHLTKADAHLNSFPAQILSLLPIARQNLQAVGAVVDAGAPTLDAAQRVLAARRRVEEDDLLEGGRIKTELIESFSRPLSHQVDTLIDLEAELDSHLSGWLLPPVWNAMEEFQDRATELRATARSAKKGAQIAGPMLGMEESRTYLVILMNNSELRGAGGILSGLGTMTFDNGFLRLGEFYYYAELSPEAVKRVPAAPDFVRRFGRYRANSTVWVNATASPDVPEVAKAAANLFSLTKKIETDGAILLDPMGIASLMPPEATVEVPGYDQAITRDQLPQFIYSDSYEKLGGVQPRRRRALLHLGEAVFAEVVGGGMNVDTLRSAGEAMAAQHIRIVSFKASERRVLENAGVSGDITTDAQDNLLVTVQNFGGDKLDYWMRRKLDHRCTILSKTSASCTSSVTFKNAAPEGLPRYVVRKKASYALYKGYQEIYIPEAAQITGFTRDGEVVEFFPETEDGRRSLGLHVEVPRGESTTTTVTYDLPLANNSYSLSVLPQPLSINARVHVEVAAPDDWVISSADTESESQFTYEGDLSGTFKVDAQPASAEGLTSLWRRLVDFWQEPLG